MLVTQLFLKHQNVSSRYHWVIDVQVISISFTCYFKPKMSTGSMNYFCNKTKQILSIFLSWKLSIRKFALTFKGMFPSSEVFIASGDSSSTSWQIKGGVLVVKLGPHEFKKNERNSLLNYIPFYCKHKARGNTFIFSGHHDPMKHPWLQLHLSPEQE